MPHPLSNTRGVLGAGWGLASRDGWSELPGVFLFLRGSLSLQSFPAQLWTFSLLWLPGWGTFSPLWSTILSTAKERCLTTPPCFSGLTVLVGSLGLLSPPHKPTDANAFAQHRNAALFLALAPCPSHYTPLRMNLPRSASCFPKSLEPQECAQVTFTRALPTFLS